MFSFQDFLRNFAKGGQSPYGDNSPVNASPVGPPGSGQPASFGHDDIGIPVSGDGNDAEPDGDVDDMMRPAMPRRINRSPFGASMDNERKMR